MSLAPGEGTDLVENLIRQHLRVVPDFPKKGVLFRDITTLLNKPDVFRRVLEEFSRGMANIPFDLIAAIEARGFILGGALADRLGVGFVPLRKAGKLPFRTLRCEYQLEYGTEILEIHADGILQGQRVMVVDDLLATGGTMEAAVKLITISGGDPVGVRVLIELVELGGRRRLTDVVPDAKLDFSALCRIHEGETS